MSQHDRMDIASDVSRMAAKAAYWRLEGKENRDASARLASDITFAVLNKIGLVLTESELTRIGMVAGLTWDALNNEQNEEATNEPSLGV